MPVFERRRYADRLASCPSRKPCRRRGGTGNGRSDGRLGIDLIDVSSGGDVPDAKIPVAPGYQVQFAKEIRERSGIKTGAVGLITEPRQAEEILESGEADAILIARESLRNPYFPFLAAQELGGIVDVPKQYGRAIAIQKAKTV